MTFVSSAATVASSAANKLFVVQETFAVDSEAFLSLKTLTSTSSDSPSVTVIKSNNDPIGQVADFVEQNPTLLVGVFVNIKTLFEALPQLHRLLNKRIVIHLDTYNTKTKDFSDFELLAFLRHAGLTFVQSFNAVDSFDIAWASYLTAAKQSKGVVHFYSSGNAGVGNSQKVTVSSDSIKSSLTEFTAVPEEESKDKTEEKEETVSVNPKTPADLSEALQYLSSTIKAASYEEFELYGPVDSKKALVVLTPNALDYTNVKSEFLIVLVRVYSPWNTDKLLSLLPKSIESLAVVELLLNNTTNWTPLVQDIISNASDYSRLAGISSFRIASAVPATAKEVLAEISSTATSSAAAKSIVLKASGTQSHFLSKSSEDDEATHAAKKLESAYINVLKQLFSDNLDILNAVDHDNTGSQTNPEFGFGKYLYKQSQRLSLLPKIKDAIKSGDFDPTIKSDLVSKLSEWALAVKQSGHFSVEDSDKIISLLSQDSGNATSKSLLENQDLLKLKSSWLIGSDAWAYDLGNSGVHNVISSGKALNMLIIDSQPYSEVMSQPGQLRKKDIGLYAMNFGNVYVASVAVYSSYTQLLQALLEAEQFPGPSVVVAYLPYKSEHDDALTVLQETKKAVQTGYWPLYRYNPLLSGEDAFKLDSFQIRAQLQAFLDRENKLTLLSTKSPAFARSLTNSYGADVREEKKSRAKEAYQQLLEGLSGPPLTVLFASDGGTAESVAKRLATRAKGRGLKAMALAFDDYPVDDFGKDENMVFVTSTAGQGEFPQNGRALWDSLKNSTDLDLAGVNVAVFGLGDSLYWPRKEDKIYYNKPAKDIANRLSILGAKELVPLGLGDEQADDGYKTAYDDWELALWTALGVDGVAGVEEPPPITNEDIKINSNFLRGTIAEGLQDSTTGAISASDQQLTKFHGIYMQDDRDIRDERKAQGLEPAYSFMVRVRLPGCVATPKQWLKIDQLCDERGNGTFKITTRGTFQLHGVIKENLKPAIRGINSALIDTVAACGDVDRNVVTAAIPYNAGVHRQIVKIANDISEHLLPNTTAYHEIWLEGQDSSDEPGYSETFANRKEGPKKTKTLVSGSTLVDHEPLYGPTYLPRKFKVNIAVPPKNDVDVYGHDIGLIAILDENQKEVVGFNVLAGGGMGTTHNNRKTYPRTGSLLGYVSRDKVVQVCEKIMLVQRDFGDRKNRKHARLKYTIDDMGVEEYKAKTEDLLGFQFEPARPYKFESNTDTFGWTTDEEGLHHFTTFVENGRVEDTPELQFRTGLREIAKYLDNHNGQFRLTANQHILVSNVTDEALPRVKELLAQYKLDNVSFSGLRLSSAACVAFPTCGLAMAESERYLPVLVTKLEEALEEYGLRHDSIVLRMTGCPNGCARPWLAEVALVGKAYGAYNLMLGGGYHGERINKLYKSSLKEDEILAELKPLFKRWALERKDGEHFGDFLVRTKVIAATTEGKNFWAHVPEDA